MQMTIQGTGHLVALLFKPLNLILFALPDVMTPWHFQRSLFPTPSNFSKILTEGSKLMASNYEANSKRRCRSCAILAQVAA